MNKFDFAIQVTVEDDNTLVIRSKGKRKRDDREEEGCKYIRLERKAVQKLLRKFRLPGNANVAAITAKCEYGVLTLVVEKLPPPPKPKTVGSLHLLKQVKGSWIHVLCVHLGF